MTRNRDVSGLMDGAVGEGATRSPGVAPPKRKPQPGPAKKSAAVPLAAVPEPPAETAETSVEPSPTPVGEPTAASAAKTVAPKPIKTGLSFTAQQLSWLHKQAERNDLWLGDLITELLAAHEAEVRIRPLQRGTRKRRGSNFTQVQVYLDPAARRQLDSVVADTGRSMAATGRLLVEVAMSGE